MKMKIKRCRDIISEIHVTINKLKEKKGRKFMKMRKRKFKFTKNSKLTTK